MAQSETSHTLTWHQWQQRQHTLTVGAAMPAAVVAGVAGAVVAAVGVCDSITTSATPHATTQARQGRGGCSSHSPRRTMLSELQSELQPASHTTATNAQ
jgi:hypothetical protein